MQDRFERFVVSITELHRYLQKLKELEMTDGLKSRLYHVSVLSGKAPGGADRHAADGAV